MKSDIDLKALTNIIKNETGLGENKATRVGGAMGDIADNKLNSAYGKTQYRKPIPMMTIRFDDGNNTDYTAMMPLFQECAGYAGEACLVDQLSAWSEAGSGYSESGYREDEQVTYDDRRWICHTTHTDAQNPRDKPTTMWIECPFAGKSWTAGDEVMHKGVPYVALKNSSYTFAQYYALDTTNTKEPGTPNGAGYWAEIPLYWQEFWGVPGCTCPVTSGLITNETLRTQQLSLQNDYGWEIMSHWHHHPQNATGWTDEMFEKEFADSYATLETYGFTKPYNCVPPGNSSDSERGRQLALRYFRSCCGIEYGQEPQNEYINYSPVEHSNIKTSRGDMAGAHCIRDGVPEGWDGDTGVANCKTAIDACVTNNGWFYWFHHTDNGLEEWPAKRARMKEVILYAMKKGVKIVTPNQALDIIGAYIDAGGSCSIGEDGVAFGYARGRGLKILDSGTVHIGYGFHGGAIAIGSRAGMNATGQVMIGTNAGRDSYARPNNNVYIGDSAGYGASYGENNIGIGRDALRGANHQSSSGIAIGRDAGYQWGKAGNGAYCTLLGQTAGKNGRGNYCVGIGYGSLEGNTVSNVVAIGKDAGKNNTEAGVFIVHHEEADDGAPLIKGYFATGGIVLGAPNAAVEDAKMGNSRVNFWLTEGETPTLNFRVKGASGAMYDGSVSLTPGV